MKKVLRFLLKPLSFVPALVIMYCIYSFSAQDGAASSSLSYKVSYKVIEITDHILNLDLNDAQILQGIHRIHFYVRKTAHFSEYFLLAVSIACPLYVYGIRGIWLLLTSGLFCIGFASLDEFHQLYVSGRSGSIRDVCIDSNGAFFGIIVTQILCYIVRKCIFDPICLRNKSI